MKEQNENSKIQAALSLLRQSPNLSAAQLYSLTSLQRLIPSNHPLYAYINNLIENAQSQINKKETDVNLDMELGLIAKGKLGELQKQKQTLTQEQEIHIKIIELGLKLLNMDQEWLKFDRLIKKKVTDKSEAEELFKELGPKDFHAEFVKAAAIIEWKGTQLQDCHEDLKTLEKGLLEIAKTNGIKANNIDELRSILKQEPNSSWKENFITDLNMFNSISEKLTEKGQELIGLHEHYSALKIVNNEHDLGPVTNVELIAAIKEVAKEVEIDEKRINAKVEQSCKEPNLFENSETKSHMQLCEFISKDCGINDFKDPQDFYNQLKVASASNPNLLDDPKINRTLTLLESKYEPSPPTAQQVHSSIDTYPVAVRAADQKGNIVMAEKASTTQPPPIAKVVRDFNENDMREFENIAKDMHNMNKLDHKKENVPQENGLSPQQKEGIRLG